MKKKIINFKCDKEGHWVAELECGHSQHVRHNPPWVNRPWVTTEESRNQRIGTNLNCRQCSENESAYSISE